MTASPVFIPGVGGGGNEPIICAAVSFKLWLTLFSGLQTFDSIVGLDLLIHKRSIQRTHNLRQFMCYTHDTFLLITFLSLKAWFCMVQIVDGLVTTFSEFTIEVQPFSPHFQIINCHNFFLIPKKKNVSICTVCLPLKNPNQVNQGLPEKPHQEMV